MHVLSIRTSTWLLSQVGVVSNLATLRGKESDFLQRVFKKEGLTGGYFLAGFLGLGYTTSASSGVSSSSSSLKVSVC